VKPPLPKGTPGEEPILCQGGLAVSRELTWRAPTAQAQKMTPILWILEKVLEVSPGVVHEPWIASYPAVGQHPPMDSGQVRARDGPWFSST
jgi:hypothetical protein